MGRKPTESGPRTAGAEGFARQVAGNLRRLRRERGWSLALLSARAGVSRAMLSQVETGKTTPTIAVLWKIATGFGVPFAELIREAPADGRVRVVRAGATPALLSADRRFRSLEELQSGIAAEINERLIGETLEVLVEGRHTKPGAGELGAGSPGHANRWKGRTRTNKLVFFDSPAQLAGQVVPVRIDWAGPWSMVGELQLPVTSHQ